MNKELTITIHVDDADVSLPAKYEVCDCCEGHGKIVNPSIDGNGITQSEMAEILYDDPDFLDNYMGGMYDVSCPECKGKRLVQVVDYDNLDEDDKKMYDEWEMEDRAFKSEQEAEMRWEAGCRGDYY